jgi:hypothetical protein
LHCNSPAFAVANFSHGAALLRFVAAEFEQPFAARFDPLGAFYNFHRDDKERHSVAGINIARP